MEIDCRPATANRPIRDGVGGPRVTRVVFAVDVGLAVNPRGLEAQMMGCVMDGIALALTSSLHLRDGYFLEASWDNHFYTRQWNTPLDLRVIIMPSTSEQPGGAGGTRRRGVHGGGGLCVRPGHRHPAHPVPDQPRDAVVRTEADGAARARVPPPMGYAMPEHSFRVNGTPVTVDVPGDVRLLWVLRDILGITGPKYGCGINVCKACTSHLNGRAVSPCAIPVGDLGPDDEVTTIEGLAATARRGAASDAAGLARPRRRPVRLLPARPDHGGRRPGPAGRRRGPRCHRRRPGRHPQRLPVRHLLPHPRGDPGGRGRHGITVS
nr:hypothetical protein GCM10020092_034920 [Actinoplanes digitatis]